MGNCLQAAGCQHAIAAANLDASDGLDGSLLGKWQYVGGKAYYLFHPVPSQCEGPGCRQAPQPASELSVIPSAVEKTSPPAANSGTPPMLTQSPQSFSITEDRLSPSPVLSGILRPPTAR